jgi:hypothetical protein
VTKAPRSGCSSEVGSEIGAEVGDEREDDDEDIAPDGEDVASLMVVEEKERKRNSRIEYKSES